MGETASSIGDVVVLINEGQEGRVATEGEIMTGDEKEEGDRCEVE